MNIRILQFKYDLEGEYTYNIVFETPSEKEKIQTNDIPLDSLLTAKNAVIDSAVDYFRLAGVTAFFKQITFSYPKDSSDSCVLEIDIKPDKNPYERLAVKSGKIILATSDEDGKNASDFNQLLYSRNALIIEIETFRNAIANYALGNRAQQKLFTGEYAQQPETQNLRNSQIKIFTNAREKIRELEDEERKEAALFAGTEETAGSEREARA
jgi:hypothetical protein